MVDWQRSVGQKQQFQIMSRMFQHLQEHRITDKGSTFILENKFEKIVEVTEGTTGNMG
jgi:hypothetical protein